MCVLCTYVEVSWLYVHIVVLGMTKVKVSKEETGSLVFVEKRRAALERYVWLTTCWILRVVNLCRMQLITVYWTFHEVSLCRFVWCVVGSWIALWDIHSWTVTLTLLTLWNWRVNYQSRAVCRHCLVLVSSGSLTASATALANTRTQWLRLMTWDFINKYLLINRVSISCRIHVCCIIYFWDIESSVPL